MEMLWKKNEIIYVSAAKKVLEILTCLSRKTYHSTKTTLLITITVVNCFLFCIRPKNETCQNLNFKQNNSKKLKWVIYLL